MFSADTLTVDVLVENWVDMLLPDLPAHAAGSPGITRSGLVEHFDPKRTPPQAENGLSLLVRAATGRRTTTVAFDAGLTGGVIAHNLQALRLDPTGIDHIVISHGHPDHYGGIYALLDAIGRTVSVATHADAFLPRYAVMADGAVSGHYNQTFNEESIQRHGGRLALGSDPRDLGCGIYTTGTIPRTIGFEGPRSAEWAGRPGLYQLSREGTYGTDEVWDEQGLVIDVKNVGLVVLTGCAHAGVVNTVLRARALVGADKPIAAVIGGFHLGFPTTPAENVALTLEEFKAMDVQTVMPMHCSGLRAQASFLHGLGARYIQPSVGTRLAFGR